jgi:hypothetical protein
MSIMLHLVPPVQAGQVVLTSTKDTSIYVAPDGNSNGSGSYFFSGTNNGGGARRGLLQFDLNASIPAGSTINSVTLELYMSRTTAPTYSVTLHRLLADWGEGSADADGQEGSGAPAEFSDASWVHRFFYTHPWATLGGDYVGTSSASTSIGGIGFYNWSGAGLVVDVQAWVDDPDSNFGWIVLGNETTIRTAKRFNARESGGTGPELTIDFTPPATSGRCCLPSGTCALATSVACGTLGGTYDGDGTSCAAACPQPAGACCLSDESCAASDPADCSASGGIFQGVGVACDPDLCPIPGGACCFDNGACSLLTQLDCDFQIGTYAGDGTTCDPVTCPAGACCFGEDCFFLAPDACGNFGGVYEGDGTSCFPNVCAGEPTCNFGADCADLDNNGIRDDKCVWWECAANGCLNVDIVFADMGGSFGACPTDGFANIHDRNHALTCFSGTNPCESINIDAGGSFGSCNVDGFCNIHDANHALTAFAGTTTCMCPTGPAPHVDPVVSGHGRLRLVPRKFRVGGDVAVEVWVDGPIDALRSYQLDVIATGGSKGGLELVDLRIEPHLAWLFAEHAHFDAFNEMTGQMLAGLDADYGVSVGSTAYLATFTYSPTHDAAGTFVVDLLLNQTFLVAPGNGQVVIDQVTPALMEIATPGKVGRTRRSAFR